VCLQQALPEVMAQVRPEVMVEAWPEVMAEAGSGEGGLQAAWLHLTPNTTRVKPFDLELQRRCHENARRQVCSLLKRF
jgi:hypothetical protein